MLFSHPTFVFLFLPALIALHFLCPRKLRNALLLAASLLFYSWGERAHGAVMLVSIVGNYGFGRLLGALLEAESVPGAATRATARRVAVTLAVVFNLALLFYFKYFGWLASEVAAGLGHKELAFAPPADQHLPIGISFFTFQALSYVIDIYRGSEKAQRSIVPFALYISLFPQLVAGPIVRYGSIARQLAARSTRFSDFAEGSRRFIAGLAKKVLIADVLLASANEVFSAPATELSAGVGWLGLTFYTLFMYFDFSGYTDMAIGLGRMFGFRIEENFRYPYVSRSITEFWRRWHISLGTWFRDYVYFPLGGSRRGTLRTYVNLAFLFTLVGAWHGAAWNFVLWGTYHGLFLVMERVLAPRVSYRLPRPLRHVYTMGVVMLSVLMIALPNLGDAIEFAGVLFGVHGHDTGRLSYALLLEPRATLVLALALVFSLPVYPAYLRWRSTQSDRAGSVARTALCHASDLTESLAWAGVLCLTFLGLSAATFSPFLYFRF